VRRLDHGAFDERGMSRRQIEKGKVQADDQVLQFQVAPEGWEPADLARHDQRLDLPFQTEAPLAVLPFDRLSRIRSISTSPMVSEIHFAAWGSLVRRKTFVAGCDSIYNRDNYGMVAGYVKAKEHEAGDCHNDPLFSQIPVTSAKRKLSEIRKLATGKDDNADKKYEDAAAPPLASLLYPHLDFAATQSRSEGGATIRDLVFYNNRSVGFLEEILQDYRSRQLVVELKNVRAIERDHINQLNRYLTNEFGAFGVLLTRNPLPKAMFKNTIELWSGQRRCILALTDSDLEMMVEVFDSKQRMPIDVLKKKYVEFRRACPS
jgi:hypothetical protein